MVLEKLGKSLREVLRKVAGASHVDEGLVKEVVRDIQRALLQADVSVELALAVTKELQRRALSEAPPPGMSAREHVIRIIYEELVKVLGKAKELPLQKGRLLMVGLYGQGKTTTVAKLARWFQKRGLSVGVIAGDTHRPAAYDQLKQLAESIHVPVYGDPGEGKAEKVVKRGLKELAGRDVVIVDTSGRHSLEDDLIREIKNVAALVKPNESILVLDAATGQQAGPQAKAFHDAMGVTAVILTKLDGTAKGGGALSAVAATGAPIVFVGVGEKIDDFEKFDPPRFVSRLLGMGDLESLLERAQEALDTERAEELSRRLLSGKLTLEDMLEQMEMLNKMGTMSKILQMIPGMPGRMSPEEMEQTQERMARFKVIIQSMTQEEKDNPKILKASRIRRIARGSGTHPKDVRELLKHYNMSKQAVRGLAGNRKMRKQLLKQLKASGMDLGG
jgi:signal recognition particle subunit SRP54